MRRWFIQRVYVVTYCEPVCIQWLLSTCDILDRSEYTGMEPLGTSYTFCARVCEMIHSFVILNEMVNDNKG